MLFKAFEKGVEVNGETVAAVIEGCVENEEKAKNILVSHGIPFEPIAGQWYSQQSWLDAFKEIAEKLGPVTLNVIGRRIPENAQFPSGISTIDEALSSIDVAYHMNHRGGEIGHYAYQNIDQSSGRMVCNNPYACPFDRGIITSVANKFKSEDVEFIDVKHAPEGPCRSKGDEECHYDINW